VITYSTDNLNVSTSLVFPLASATSANSFTYEYANLLAGETRYILVNMLVDAIPTVNLGDIITNSVSISLPTADINTGNNTFITSQTVVGSYDPNDKTKARGENVPIGQFSQDDYLFYTIRFQNSGSASAETVRIEDVLAAQFDFASVQMISTSHDYSMERVNNKLTWTFNEIDLPTESVNEPGSHSYVTFKIKLNSGFVVGDVIENSDEIYFDFNPAIVTIVSNDFCSKLKGGFF
jgi:fimbrial isopeptide formation D2 family protein